MLIYPYFTEWYFYEEPVMAGLFLGTAIHETSQVAAAGLIYDQQFNSPETLNVGYSYKINKKYVFGNHGTIIWFFI